MTDRTATEEDVRNFPTIVILGKRPAPKAPAAPPPKGTK
jgi:hypothetical protein